MHKRLVLLIDGGCLRQWASDAGKTYDPALIEKVARLCAAPAGEELFRVLYYDCPQYSGTVKLPVSGTDKSFTSNDGWMRDLAKRDLFAVRRGVLKFRGWKPKKPGVAGSDSDFSPVFEQKGVDMRIGLDIANYSSNRLVDVIGIITADTDMVPAFKLARRSGLQIALVQVAGIKKGLSEELLMHSDFHRTISWP